MLCVNFAEGWVEEGRWWEGDVLQSETGKAEMKESAIVGSVRCV